MRTVRENWYSLSNSPGALSIKLRPEMIYEKVNPSFVGRRQQHLNCDAVALLKFTPQAEKETAGIIAFQNENHYYYLGKTLFKGKPVVQLRKQSSVIAQIELGSDEVNKPLYLKIESQGKFYHFYYSTSRDTWQTVKKSVDGKFLSTEVAGGFVGTMMGMYASSQEHSSSNIAKFDWFSYRGDDVTFNLKNPHATSIGAPCGEKAQRH